MSFSPDSFVSPTDKLGRARARFPLSCTECTRRKTKCDQKVPCRSCSERGKPQLCHRRQIGSLRARNAPVAGETERVDQPRDGVSQDITTLRRRIDHIESILGIDTVPSPVEGQAELDFRGSGLAGVMEEATLEIGEPHRWQGAKQFIDPVTSPKNQEHGPPFLSVEFLTCVAAMPSPNKSQLLLDAFFEHLNWMCGCIHRPSLLRWHNDFWSSRQSGSLPDGILLSLLFAVYSCSAYLLDEHQAQSAGLNPEELRSSAKLWFDCSLGTFFRCDGLSSPSLVACQALLTLNYCFHLSGNSRIHAAVPSIVMGMARAINLHLLGTVQSDSPADSMQLEIGSRVWWNIVEVEWHFLPYHRYTSIMPHQFNTSMPNLTDEGVRLEQSPNHLHSLSFLLASCKSSRILFDLYGTLEPNQHPSYRAVLSASDQMEKLRHDIESLPIPPGLVYMQRVLCMALAYRSYIVHRPFYVRSLRERAFHKSRTICIEAAETILKTIDSGIPAPFYRLWNVTLWLVSTGIILAFDLIQTSRNRRSPLNIVEKRRRLAALVDVLKTMADRSGIGLRGAKLISHLCALELDISAGTSPLPHFTRRQILSLVRSGEKDTPVVQEPYVEAFQPDPSPALVGSSTLNDHHYFDLARPATRTSSSQVPELAATHGEDISLPLFEGVSGPAYFWETMFQEDGFADYVADLFPSSFTPQDP